jgi:hypothetical protein
MWVKNQDVNNLFWDEVDYGVDAKEGKPLEMVADERYRWGSFDELMSNIDEVRSAYATGPSWRLSDWRIRSPLPQLHPTPRGLRRLPQRTTNAEAIGTPAA